MIPIAARPRRESSSGTRRGLIRPTFGHHETKPVGVACIAVARDSEDSPRERSAPRRLVRLEGRRAHPPSGVFTRISRRPNRRPPAAPSTIAAIRSVSRASAPLGAVVQVDRPGIDVQAEPALGQDADVPEDGQPPDHEVDVGEDPLEHDDVRHAERQDPAHHQAQPAEERDVDQQRERRERRRAARPGSGTIVPQKSSAPQWIGRQGRRDEHRRQPRRRRTRPPAASRRRSTAAAGGGSADTSASAPRPRRGSSPRRGSAPSAARAPAGSCRRSGSPRSAPPPAS